MDKIYNIVWLEIVKNLTFLLQVAKNDEYKSRVSKGSGKDLKYSFKIHAESFGLNDSLKTTSFPVSNNSLISLILFLDESIRNMPTTSRPYSLIWSQHDLTMFGTKPSLLIDKFW